MPSSRRPQESIQRSNHIVVKSTCGVSLMPVDGSLCSSAKGTGKGVARLCKKASKQRNQHRGADRIRHHITIDVLSDDILLGIFHFYRVAVMEPWDHSWSWYALVHTCRRWRLVIFASPKRLDLRVLCTYGTPVKKALGYWPSFPVIVNYWDHVEFKPPTPEDEDNIIAALEDPDRVSRVEVILTSSLSSKLVTVMGKRFSSLTYLRLRSADGTTPIFPSDFLGGSAPRIQNISLDGITFPALPRLLLSSSDLVSLRLWRVPNAGNISPEVMVACLSSLVKLEWLAIGFHSPIFHSDRLQTLPTRAILPALTQFNFQGVSEYLEDLLMQIEVPLLEHVGITYFNQLIFDIPQLSTFSHHTRSLGPPVRANIYFSSDVVLVSLYSPGAMNQPCESFSLRILCKELDWQVSSVAQICNQLPLFSEVGHLDISMDHLQPGLQDNMEPAEWVELLRPFVSVKSLDVSGAKPVGPHIALALEKVAEGIVMNVLPVLHTLRFHSHRRLTSVRQFIAARHFSGHPIEVHYG